MVIWPDGEEREKRCKSHSWLDINIKSHVVGLVSMGILKVYVRSTLTFIDFVVFFLFSFSTSLVFIVVRTVFREKLFPWELSASREMLSVYIGCLQRKKRERTRISFRYIYFKYYTRYWYDAGMDEIVIWFMTLIWHIFSNHLSNSAIKLFVYSVNISYFHVWLFHAKNDGSLINISISNLRKTRWAKKKQMKTDGC